MKSQLELSQSISSSTSRSHFNITITSLDFYYHYHKHRVYNHIRHLYHHHCCHCGFESWKANQKGGSYLAGCASDSLNFPREKEMDRMDRENSSILLIQPHTSTWTHTHRYKQTHRDTQTQNTYTQTHTHARIQTHTRTPWILRWFMLVQRFR